MLGVSNRDAVVGSTIRRCVIYGFSRIVATGCHRHMMSLISTDRVRLPSPGGRSITIISPRFMVDGTKGLGKTRRMPATLIVLNGASSAGKSSIARALQDLWPRPLLVTGIDTFIAGWPQSFVKFPGVDGTPSEQTVGLRVVPGHGPAPSWILESGEDFTTLMQLAHRAWALLNVGGIDQVVDHAMFERPMRLDALGVLSNAYWVGVTCDIDELVRREALRSDRFVGFASGSSAVVHEGMHYDLVVDSTTSTSEELARQIFDAFKDKSR